MRTTLVILIWMMVCSLGFSQSGSDHASMMVGDTLLLATDRLPSNRRIAVPTSGDYWNFRSLQAPFTRTVMVRANRSDGIPADIVLAENSGVDYYVEEYQGNLWVTAISVQISDKKYFGRVEGDMPYRIYDLEEGDTVSYSGKAVLTRSAHFEEGELENADSVRIIAVWNYNLTRDISGEIDLESGLFDASRYTLKKSVLVNTEARRFGKWSAVETTNADQLPHLLQPGITYSWWSDRIGQPLAYVYADKYGSARSVTFMASPLVGRKVIQDLPTVPDIFVHPNPTFGFVRFEMINLPADDYRIELYNIIGVIIRDIEVEVDGRLTVPQDFSDLKRGTYIYRLVNSSGKTIRSKRLVIIKP